MSKITRRMPFRLQKHVLSENKILIKQERRNRLIILKSMSIHPVIGEIPPPQDSPRILLGDETECMDEPSSFYPLSCYHDQFFGEVQDGKHVDQVLRDYFPDYAYQGIFFDVGAFEPIRISNSHHFHLNGWKVYCFEANPNKIPLLKEHRDYVFNYAITDHDSQEPLPFESVSSGEWTASFSAIKVSEKYKEIFGWHNATHNVEIFLVEQKTLNSVIKEEILELSHIDILSLDVEGKQQLLYIVGFHSFPAYFNCFF